MNMSDKEYTSGDIHMGIKVRGNLIKHTLGSIGQVNHFFCYLTEN